MKRYMILAILFLWIFPCPARAGVTRGIFGVPSIKKVNPSRYLSQIKGAGINAVFVAPDGETIRWFKGQGFKVYISVNAFGGKEGWKRYPDSRPVKADGRLLGSEPGYKGYGGVCPSHRKWRNDRLKYIERLVDRFGGLDGIDGIWLDFIRYPGLWEVERPNIPDTCYGPNSLERFQADLHIRMPGRLNAKEAALWIEKNHPHAWMKWKKAQISSFVADVKKILASRSAEKKLILGLFLVPWTKGERQNAISYKLAQDALQLSRLADVISPMVYHKMSGRDVSWVGSMTEYYKETAHSQVWPIVQSEECGPEELGNVLKSAGRAGADGILVFSFKGTKPELWKSFKEFQRPVNLIINPEFDVPEGNELPRGWYTGKSKGGKVRKSTFFVRSSEELSSKEGELESGQESNSIGISAGNDGSGVWYSQLPDCEPGVEYVFEGSLFRERRKNGIYPSISLWGQEFYVNNHRMVRTFQPIRLYTTCPEEIYDHSFRFLNNNQGRTFWLSKPSLTKNYRPKAVSEPEANQPDFYKDFFPIGVYGATIDNLPMIKELSVNTVLFGGHGEGLKEMVQKSHQLGLKYVLSVPRDTEKLHVFLNEIAGYVRPREIAFYVNDEPGIHSFPINRANDINRLIKDRFPEAATCMAVVRPQVSRDYLEASDFFMMDQYPVPFMPMTWLSDSMDRAAGDAGRNRLVSVVQAFGGKRWANAGWPRMPTWQEMDSLSFLSVVHGSRGIFFYTFSEIGKTEEGRQRLGFVVKRLNRLYPWLVERNLDQEVNVEMVSPHRVDPKGRPAVHCSLKKKGDQVLLLAVNAIETYVEAVIHLRDAGLKGHENSVIEEFKEVFGGELYPVIDGGLRVKFRPFETKAFVGKAVRR